MSKPSVVIDCFPESVQHYRKGYAVVAIDVIRATTTAITAVANGRRCLVAPSLQKAYYLAATLNNPLLVGEVAGTMPIGFDINNSPQEIAQRTDIMRPIVLLSSTGTQLIHNLQDCNSGYIACFRNYGATINHLINNSKPVALIGAGSRGEFREEDKMCCAWIANGLTKAGYNLENDRTIEVVEQWKDATVEACTQGNSAKYLRKTGQIKDLEFILKHVNDLYSTFTIKNNEVLRIPVSECAEIEH